jgi:hypothetical protein
VSSPSKRKGTAFETLVANYLGVERKTLKGNRDEGDLIVPDWALELKATKEIDLAGAIDEARVEAKNAGVPHFAAIIKRRGRGVGEAYVVQTLEQWARLVKA